VKLSIIAVGRLKEKYLKEGIAEYSKRLSRFCDLEIIEVEDEQASENIRSAQEIQIKKREAEKIKKRIKEGSFVVVLDLKGEKPDSIGFAKKVEAFFISGVSSIVFIIGGSLGIDDEFVKAANYRLCLSELTFPHQLARLILLEQLFRCFKIIKGETYHK
jgi:23S rRNA (pseudouridine1915-N3)-methyltransferase